MKHKLILAWKMITFINSSENSQNTKMYMKCLRQYILQCIILRKDYFKLRFGSEYYDRFYLRLKDWVEYIIYIITIPFWRLIPNEKYRPFYANYCIKNGIRKTVHMKKRIYVNETLLEYFLDESGFMIQDEQLSSLQTVYYIKEKEERF